MSRCQVANVLKLSARMPYNASANPPRCYDIAQMRVWSGFQTVPLTVLWCTDSSEYTFGERDATAFRSKGGWAAGAKGGGKGVGRHTGRAKRLDSPCRNIFLSRFYFLFVLQVFRSDNQERGFVNVDDN